MGVDFIHHISQVKSHIALLKSCNTTPSTRVRRLWTSTCPSHSIGLQWLWQNRLQWSCWHRYVDGLMMVTILTRWWSIRIFGWQNRQLGNISNLTLSYNLFISQDSRMLDHLHLKIPASKCINIFWNYIL